MFARRRASASGITSHHLTLLSMRQRVWEWVDEVPSSSSLTVIVGVVSVFLAERAGFIM